jgi:hypothetical protein
MGSVMGRARADSRKEKFIMGICSTKAVMTFAVTLINYYFI